MRDALFAFFLINIFCVVTIYCTDELVYFYGEPAYSYSTGFVRIDPTNGWQATARGFATKNTNLLQDINGVAFNAESNTIIFYGYFHFWNDIYVGGLLQADAQNLKIDTYGHGIQGKEVASSVFISPSELLVAGSFSGFAQAPTTTLNWVGICAQNGATCFPLGQPIAGVVAPMNVIAIERQIYMLYLASFYSEAKIATYDYSNSNANLAWTQSLSLTCQGCILVEYQGTPWVFGGPDANGTSGAYEYQNGTWKFYETSTVNNLPLASVRVSPDGNSVYIQEVYPNLGIFYKWNDTAKDWQLWSENDCQYAEYAAFDTGIITTCNASVLKIEETDDGLSMELISDSACAIECSGVYVDPSNSYFLLLAAVDADHNALSLSTFDINSASSLVCCQTLNNVEELVLFIQGMCVYGDKIFLTGGFEQVDNVQTPSQMALWDQSRESWYAVTLPSQQVTAQSCYCDTDGNTTAVLCQVKNSAPVLLIDSASTQAADSISSYTLTDVGNATLTTSVAVQGDVVFFVSSNSKRTNMTLFYWTKQSGAVILSSIFGTGASNLKAVGNILYIAGTMNWNNYTIRIAEYQFEDSEWIIPDHLMPEFNSSAYTLDYCQNGVMYVGGNFDFAGTLRAENLAGYNLNGTAVDSAGSGLPKPVSDVACYGNKLYLVYFQEDCPTQLYPYCGILVNYDLTTQEYSPPIVLGVSAVATGPDIDQPVEDDSSSGLTKTSKIIILAALIAAGGGIILSVVCIGIKAGAKKYSRRFYQEISDSVKSHNAIEDINFETEKFEIKNVLGKGTFGTVWSCVFPNSNAATFAVKQILLSKGDTERIQAVQNEIEILKKLRHPNIVHFLGSKMTTSSSFVEFFIFMELYDKPCSLKGVIMKKLEQAQKRKFPEWFTFEEVRKFMRQISDGLHYLHEQGIAHRDLKSANILVRTEGNSTTIKSLHIADFGISKSIDPGNTTSRLAMTVVGSLGFMAPEIIREEKYDPFRADIWAFGMVLYEILTWQENQKPGVRPEFPLTHPLSQFNKQFERVIEIFNDCTEENPLKRPTCEELFHMCSDM